MTRKQIVDGNGRRYRRILLYNSDPDAGGPVRREKRAKDEPRERKGRESKREDDERDEKPRRSRRRERDETDEPVPPGEWNGPKPGFLDVGFG